LRNIYQAKADRHQVIEIEKLNKLKQTLNWCDTHRKFVHEHEKLYSWWSYRNQDWRKSNRGRRLDHIWVTANMEKNIKNAWIFKDARDWNSPSDHVPIGINLIQK
jgi:exodeoxyribonuclease-3